MTACKLGMSSLIKLKSHHIEILAVFFVSGIGSGCSPYIFSDQIQTFGGKVTAIDSAYKQTEQNIHTEKYLDNRYRWLQEHDKIARGPGCKDLINHPSVEPCTLITIEDPQKVEKQVHDGTDSAEKPAGANESEKRKSNVQNLDPAQKAGFLNALDNYVGALVAITKVEDRAAFDSAAGKASSSIGALAASAGLASGVGAAGAPLYGAVAKASSSAIFWLIGQGLDRQRLDQLQISTSEAQKYIPTLADVIGDPILADQRRKRLDILDGLLTRKIFAVNVLVDELSKQKPAVTSSVWNSTVGPVIDEAQAAADTYEAVRITNPTKTAEALTDAHTNLATAIANNDGQSAALISSLQTFVEKVNELEKAASAIGSANPATSNTITK